MPEGFDVGLGVHERRRGTDRRARADRRGAERRASQRRCRDAVVRIERRIVWERREGDRRWHARRGGDDRRVIRAV
jgi:hypothetical protein